MKSAALKYLICFGAALLLPFAVVAAEETQKPHIVSLDYCSDQYVLALADRDQIMALSREATDSHSFYRELAEGLPRFGSTAEEILSLAPDRVIRNWAGYNMLGLLGRTGLEVTSVGFGHDRRALMENIRRVGEAVGQPQRAEETIKDLARRMDLLESRPRRKQLVLYLTPSGVTAGKGTYVNDLLNLAGFRTMADEFDYYGWKDLPLELLAERKPDLIIAGFFDLDFEHNSSWRITRFGLIDRMLGNIPTIYMPGKYLSCNGIFLPDAAEYIHRELDGVQR
ncbi:ABC transporter substrate-binding protein [Emcibacter sp.]|uniref:ABC transporter substrate-binding protein n=1 Tax=Emcibacter sp. TaxID=1979954 RepID=UPI002AA70889|nr:ABC transporter substrate-binding protein [Emcibacter sp.]